MSTAIPTYEAALARAQKGALLSCADMAAIWQVTMSTLYRMRARGVLDKFLVVPIGPPRYSGALVYRYVTGDPIWTSRIGGKAAKAGAR